MPQGLRAFRALGFRKLCPFANLKPQRPVGYLFNRPQKYGLLAQCGGEE